VPIARYFMVVGNALLALLLIAGWSLPEFQESFPDRPEIIERAAIRIRSERKWPEKIVLDTIQPTIPTPSIEVAPTEQLLARLPDEMTDQTRVDPLPMPNADARPIVARRRPAQARDKPARHSHRLISPGLVFATSPQHGARARSVVGLSGRMGQQYQELYRASVSRIGTHG
jgi:hypothetical protein